MSECVEMTRARSRRILNQLSMGERFMLLFGKGKLKRDPLRVEWKEPTPPNSHGCDSKPRRILMDESQSKESFV